MRRRKWICWEIIYLPSSYSTLFFFFFFFFFLLLFFFPYILLNFYLSTIGIGVNLYNLHFLYSHFSSQLNKKNFYPFTFPLPPTKHHERKTKSLLSINSYLFHSFSIFYPSLVRLNQTDPKFFTKELLLSYGLGTTILGKLLGLVHTLE